MIMLIANVEFKNVELSKKLKENSKSKIVRQLFPTSKTMKTTHRRQKNVS